MLLQLTEKQAEKVLLLVRHYSNLLKNSKPPAKPDTIEFYETLYDDIGLQLMEERWKE